MSEKKIYQIIAVLLSGKIEVEFHSNLEDFVTSVCALSGENAQMKVYEIVASVDRDEMLYLECKTLKE